MPTKRSFKSRPDLKRPPNDQSAYFKRPGKLDHITAALNKTRSKSRGGRKGGNVQQKKITCDEAYKILGASRSSPSTAVDQRSVAWPEMGTPHRGSGREIYKKGLSVGRGGGWAAVESLKGGGEKGVDTS